MIWEKLRSILPIVEKPARYIGNEINTIVKPESAVNLRMALAFPDVYEIGSSYMGYQILYDILNRIEGVQAERVFAPWPDMEQQMRQAAIPLYGLESKTALQNFDIIGFTLQHELSYTNIINMMDLAGLPPATAMRDSFPLIIGGGPGAFNPEPLAEFFDAFVIGEGEEVVHEIIELVRECRAAGLSRDKILRKLADIQGIYVPSLYAPNFDDNGRYIGTFPVDSAISPRILKRAVLNFEHYPLPAQIVVPLVQPVHDRVSLEICRGCARGCRFCQAGMIYRPVRERPGPALLEQGRRLLGSTGSLELSLSSLSSADYSGIGSLVQDMLNITDVSVSLPSLRVDSFSVELARLTKSVRSTGLTLAPEAGSQRLRDVINKNVREASAVWFRIC